MSLATAGIYCTISPPLSSTMADYSIVQAQQLGPTWVLCPIRSCPSPSGDVDNFGKRSKQNKWEIFLKL